ETPNPDSIDFDEPHQFQTHTPAQPARYAAPGPDSVDFDEPHAFAGADTNDDLESALSTLDVDLDRLADPPGHARAKPRASRPLPGMPPERLDPPTVRPTGDDLRAKPVARNVTPRAGVKSPSKAPAPPTKRPTRELPDDDDDGGVLIDFDDD
ncbi:MAG TPA: hypothetical protein VGC41_17440, partial [Kofleriaceae bacterium]